MREIGGYFEWEMERDGAVLHPEASLLLKSGRSCLGLLLERQRPAKVWAPYYICDGALEPFATSATPVEFYALDERFEIAGDPPELRDDEALLYIDYFGLKATYVRQLERRYRDRLWVDHVQAFFHVPDERSAYHFNSARKYFGVPDGAYLYLPSSAPVPSADAVALRANSDYRLEHLTLRLEGKTQEGRGVFEENERLNGGEVTGISDIGRAMLSRIDYSSVARRRRDNYRLLHAALAEGNQISASVSNLGADAVPFCYPFLPTRPMRKQYFWDRKIYVPVLWRECADRVADGYRLEKRLCAELLALPVDQRCHPADMDRVAAAVRDYPHGGG